MKRCIFIFLGVVCNLEGLRCVGDVIGWVGDKDNWFVRYFIWSGGFGFVCISRKENVVFWMNFVFFD